MCQNVIPIAQTKEGRLSLCTTCKLYNLTFNNILLEFTKDEFLTFQNYIKGIEMDYWEERYSENVLARKIPIQTIQSNLFLMFTRHEIACLKKLVLLNENGTYEYIRFKNIDYNLLLN